MKKIVILLGAIAFVAFFKDEITELVSDIADCFI